MRRAIGGITALAATSVFLCVLAGPVRGQNVWTPGVPSTAPPGIVLAQGLPRKDGLPSLNVTPRVIELPPGEIQTAVVDAGLAYSTANRRGFSFRTDRRGGHPGIRCRIQADRGAIDLIVRYQGATGGFDWGKMEFSQNCVFRLFGRLPLDTGWVMAGVSRYKPVGNCARRFGRLLIGEQSNVGSLFAPVVNGNPYDDAPKLLLQGLVNPNNNVCTEFRWRLERIKLRGPAGADWRAAFHD